MYTLNQILEMLHSQKFADWYGGHSGEFNQFITGDDADKDENENWSTFAARQERNVRVSLHKMLYPHPM